MTIVVRDKRCCPSPTNCDLTLFFRVLLQEFPSSIVSPILEKMFLSSLAGQFKIIAYLSLMVGMILR
jgi:hypothetical protein